MSKTFDTLGNDTVGVVFDNLGNCRERSSSPLKDYADRDLGSSKFLRIRCLLSQTGSWTPREFPNLQGLGNHVSQPRGFLRFLLPGGTPVRSCQ